MVAEGTFRQDLYYRINVMGIKSPALRDHADDIPVLARHFMEEYSRLYRRQVKIVAPAAMSLLLEYEWPGMFANWRMRSRAPSSCATPIRFSDSSAGSHAAAGDVGSWGRASGKFVRRATSVSQDQSCSQSH